MMVQASEEVGKIPIDTQDTPILNQPSTSQPQRKHKPRRKQRNETEVSQDEPPTEEHIPTPSHDPLPSGEDRLQLNELMEIYTKLSDMVLYLEQTKTTQVTKIEKLKKRVKKLEGKKKKRTHRLKRLYKVGEEYDLDSDEVFVDVTTSENVEQDATVAEKEVSTANDEVVTTAEDVEVDVAATLQISKDDETLAQTLMEIKAVKPKTKGVMIQEPSEFRITLPSQPSQLPQDKDKEVARQLEAQMKVEMKEEERIAREKDKANIAVIEE
nr:hypothetical protein [Tanacetum cinerariifolium]